MDYGYGLCECVTVDFHTQVKPMLGGDYVDLQSCLLSLAYSFDH